MSELKHLHSSVELNESRSGKEAVEVRHRRDGRDVTTIYGASVDPSAANGSVFEGVVPKSESARSLLDKALKDHYFFTSLEPSALQAVVDAMYEREVVSGETLIQQGQQGEFFYVVEKGVFAVQVDGQQVGTVTEGGSFGELALLYDSPRPASVEARKESVVWCLGRETFRKVIARTSTKNLQETKDVLQHAPLLKSLTPVQVSKIAMAVKEVSFEKGTVIIKKGDVGDAFYFIKSGIVRITDVGSGIRATKDIFLESPAYFGERALLLDEPRAATVVAESEKVVCFRLEREDVMALLGPLRDVMDHNMGVDVLQALPHLRGLTRKQLHVLADEFRRVKFDDGDLIVDPDRTQNMLFVIRDGSALETHRLPGKDLGNPASSFHLRRTSNTMKKLEELRKSEDPSAIADTVGESPSTTKPRTPFASNSGGSAENHQEAAPSVGCAAWIRKMCGGKKSKQHKKSSDSTGITTGTEMVALNDTPSTPVLKRKSSRRGSIVLTPPAPATPATPTEDKEQDTSALSRNSSANSTFLPDLSVSRVLRVGDYFGEDALLEGLPYSSVVVARGPVTCFVLDRKGFERALGPVEDMLKRLELQEQIGGGALANSDGESNRRGSMDSVVSVKSVGILVDDTPQENGNTTAPSVDSREETKDRDHEHSDEEEKESAEDPEHPSDTKVSAEVKKFKYLETPRIGSFSELKGNSPTKLPRRGDDVFTPPPAWRTGQLRDEQPPGSPKSNRSRIDTGSASEALSDVEEEEDEVVVVYRHTGDDGPVQEANSMGSDVERERDGHSPKENRGRFSSADDTVGRRKPLRPHGAGAGRVLSPGLESSLERSVKGEMARQTRGEVGFRLQDFERRVTLGVGTFGRVRLVVHKPTGKLYALKILRKLKVNKLNQRRNVLNEKAVMEGLQHPFLLRLVHTFRTSTTLYMLLELVQGGELFTLQGQYEFLPSSHARFYASCVVEALRHMHRHGFMYRDLKPENLLIDKEGYIRVVDFGFAKRIKDRTFTLCGTPEYLAPEIVIGKGYTEAVDLWALGVLIYEMLCGESPFADDTQEGTFKKILRAKIRFPQEVADVEAKSLIKELLTRDVVRRIGCRRKGVAEVMQHSWFRKVDWRKLVRKELPAPWVPPLSSEDDTRHFEEYDEDSDDEGRGDPPDLSGWDAGF